jgi:phosphate butyryltransferase
MARSARLEQLIGMAQEQGPKRMAVIWPHDAEMLAVLAEATVLRLVDVTVVGRCSRLAGTPGEAFECIDVADVSAAIAAAVSRVRDGQADLLMNGLAAPDDVFRAVLDKNGGLRGRGRLSAVSALDVPRFDRWILLGDTGLAIAPGLDEKAAIVQNTVDVAHLLGVATPRVALLAATEMVNPKAQASLHAAELTKMAQRGQIKGCIVDGPLALDNSVSPESVAVKGIVSDVGGMADILIGPDLDTSNILMRSLAHLARLTTATVVVGGQCPMAMPSRSDAVDSRLASLALAVCLCTPAKA